MHSRQRCSEKLLVLHRWENCKDAKGLDSDSWSCNFKMGTPQRWRWYIGRGLIPLHHQHLGSEKLQVLFEQWISCDGHWTESSIYKQLKVTVRNRKTGARKWLTEAELTVKYGSARVAERIVQSKQNDAECSKTQIREHPDCPGDPVSSLNPVLVKPSQLAPL